METDQDGHRVLQQRGSKGVWEYEKNEKDHQPLAGCYFSDHRCGSAIWHPGNPGGKEM